MLNRLRAVYSPGFLYENIKLNRPLDFLKFACQSHLSRQLLFSPYYAVKCLLLQFTFLKKGFIDKNSPIEKPNYDVSQPEKNVILLILYHVICCALFQGF